MAAEKAFAAFSSYSHATDHELGPLLQEGIETFAKPWYRPRGRRVFLDNSVVAAESDLTQAILDGLSAAEHFLLLASPVSARSRRVAEEVAWRLENRDRRTLFVLLTDGEAVWDNGVLDQERTNALPEALRGVRHDPRDPGWESVPADVVAPLGGIDKSELIGHHVRERRRTKLSVRRVLPLLLLLAACGDPAAGPKITGAPQPGTSTVVQTMGPSERPKPSLAQASDDLHAVDWQQATLTAEFCGVEKAITMRDGEVTATSTIWGEVGLWINTAKPVRYGDVDGDGRDEAAVNVGCGTASSRLAFGLVVVRSRDGALELVGEIGTTTMRDDAPHVPLLTEPRFEKGAITVKELWYRPSDANCCPTGASLTRWWLRDGTLKPDPAVQVS